MRIVGLRNQEPNLLPFTIKSQITYYANGYHPLAREVVIGLASELPPAVILAGGLGTRLRPIVSERPKAMALVAGRPFLIHQLQWLQANSVRSVILCLGYKGEQIANYFGDGSSLDLAIIYSWEETPLGTAGALAQAVDLLPHEFLVVNGDTYTVLPLQPLWDAHHEYGAIATLAVAPAQDSSAVGGIELDPDHRIVAFREKESGAKLVSMGIYAATRKLVELIPQSRPCSLEKDIFPHLPRLYGYLSEARFIDIGTPAGYLALDRYLSSSGS